MPADHGRPGCWYRIAPCLFWSAVYLALLALTEYLFITELLVRVPYDELDAILTTCVAAPLAAYAAMCLTMATGWLLLKAIPDRSKEQEQEGHR